MLRVIVAVVGKAVLNEGQQRGCGFFGYERRGVGKADFGMFDFHDGLPFFCGFEFAPGNVFFRIVFVVLQDKAADDAAGTLQRTFYGRLFVLREVQGIRDFAEFALFFFFAGDRMFVVQHVFKQLVVLGEALVDTCQTTRPHHIIYGFSGFSGEGVVNGAADDGVEGVIHFARFFEMADGDIAAGEGTFGKVFMMYYQ